MTITGIEPRRKSMSALYIDGEYVMNLDTETLAINGIKTGMEIDDETLLELIKKSDERRAKEKALYLISHRDHSKKELIDKIKRTSNEQAAQFAAKKMEELGLINDTEFAKKYARELLEFKKFSKNRASFEMAKKGLDKELITEILDDMDINPVEQICSIINKKYVRYLNDEKGQKRVISAMQRLGYRWEDIKSALNYFKANLESWDC